MGRAQPAVHRGRRGQPAPAAEPEAGFLLLETVVAISIITIVMTALVGVLVTVTQSTSRQRSGQVAAQLAVAATDRARAVGAAGAVSGRDVASSAAQLGRSPATPDFPAAAPAVAPWLATMSTATDPTAGTGVGAYATLPTVPAHQVVNGLTFSVSYFVGYCWRSGAVGESDCASTATAGTVQYVRVVVVAAWSGNSCPPTGCTFVSATLVNGTGDPVFNFNQTPPPEPVLSAVPDQNSAAGDTVAGLTITGCPAPCAAAATAGVPPLIFAASGLPPGLDMDSGGMVTGTPTSAGSYPVTVTVTDGFLDTATTQFLWTVKAALAFTVPPAQTSAIGSTVSLAVTGATGGTGSGYRWSATGLPPGLAINSDTGLISGTVAASAGSSAPYPAAVTLTDSSGVRTVTGSFAWTVAYQPLATSDPGTQTSTIGQPVTFGLAGSVSGGSGSDVWTDPGGTLPAGLAISGDGQSVTGSPTLTGSNEVWLTVTDLVTGASAQLSFTWTVAAAPTLPAPSPPATSTGGTVTMTVPFGCANTPCAVTASGLPAGLRLGPAGASAVPVTGTVTAAPGTYPSTVTVRDAAGATASTSFAWPVLAAPTVAAASAPATTVTATVSYGVGFTCPTTHCTFGASGLPSGLSIGTATGASGTVPITGSVGGAAKTYTGIRLTVTDADGSTARSSTFSWTVKSPPTLTNPKSQSTRLGTTVSLAPTSTCPNGPCTFTLTNQPSWLTVDVDTGKLTGTPQVVGSWTVTLTITDAAGVSSSQSFSWTVTQ
jgi:type II secretory pathway pseudopilin PulG